MRKTKLFKKELSVVLSLKQTVDERAEKDEKLRRQVKNRLTAIDIDLDVASRGKGYTN